MLRNHLLIAIRLLKRSPLYFLISVMGFSLSLLACILLLRFVSYEMNYDSDLPDNLYRIGILEDEEASASTPVPTGPALKNELTAVTEYIRFAPLRGIIKAGTNEAGFEMEDIVMGDGDFFTSFNLQLLKGSRNEMVNPGRIYISESVALRLFDQADELIGKEVLIYENNFGEMKLTVAGIYKDRTEQTHVPIQAFVSLSTLELYNQNSFWAKTDNWGWNSFYTYVRMEHQPEEEELLQLLDKYVGAEYREQQKLSVQFIPVGEVHTTINQQNEYSEGTNAAILHSLMAISFFILVIAAVNYINMTSAKGLKRAKEVGLRKNMGGSRSGIIRQFSLEAMIILAISFLITITLYQLLKPVLEEIMGRSIYAEWNLKETFLLLIVIIPVLFWSAWQPSWILSRFSLREVIQGKIQYSSGGRSFRKFSVIFQMVISLILLCGVILIQRQVRYMQNLDLGMNIDHLLIIERPKDSKDITNQASLSFENALRAMAPVSSVTVSGSVPGNGFNWSTNALQVKGSQNDQRETLYAVTYIDNYFVHTYDINLLAGVGAYQDEDNTLKILINEAASKSLGFTSPEEAVDRVLINGDTEMKVIGVVGNYFHQTSRQSYSPTVMLLDRNPQFYTIRYHTGDTPLQSSSDIVALSESVFQTYFPEGTFDYSFPDEVFRDKLNAERKLNIQMGLFSGLAIFLSCIGLVGLSIFTLESRSKEMGIRKILGASSISLFGKLSGGISAMVLISSIVALPVAYVLVTNWLQNYPNRIIITPWPMLLPVLILLFFSLASVSYQFFKLSTTNAIESIRYE